tara:strand:- start:70 stop:1398 length:1329 start_codon:yes stop_codon:yes gene_type:complete
MSKILVSIIIRTRNEGFWIGKCLHEIENQDYKNYEVIVVDNSSTDRTLGIVKNNFPKAKIIKYKSKEFFPGKALNLGIQASKGRLIAMISGHCIPKNKLWLSNLIKNFKNKKVAGVYGKQEPLDMSNPSDARDLIYLFGKDKKIQNKDPFFHNANSMIRRDLWKKIKLDENTRHIEDRMWAQKQINKGYKIVYEPKSSVFHYHGVNHNDNISRVRKINKILTKVSLKKNSTNLICIVPILKPIIINGEFLVEQILREVIKINKIKKIFIICNNKLLRQSIKNKKITYINRNKNLEKDFLGSDYVLKEVFNKFIKKKYKPSHILVFEEIYLFRPKNFFNSLINNIDDNYDCLVPICQNKDHNIWKKNDKGDIKPIFKTTLPSSLVNHTVFQENKGLGCITKSSNFENNGRESVNTKFFEVDSKYSFKISNFIKELISKRFLNI